MGLGNKLHPEQIEVADIYATSVCRLARVMRRELKQAGVAKLTCVYSKEKPIAPQYPEGAEQVPGSVSFVPPGGGMILAGLVIRAIAQKEEELL